jgi:hypothetical protein
MNVRPSARKILALLGTTAVAGVVTVTVHAPVAPHQTAPVAAPAAASTFQVHEPITVKPTTPQRPAVAPVAHTKPVAPKRPAKKAVVTKAPTKRIHHAKKAKSYPAGPTSWGPLNAAIARIPSYQPGAVRWVVKNTGWWATADWYENVIYISPTTSESKLYDVVVHEWSHILSVRTYGGNVEAAIAAMKLFFGGPGLEGSERAADCMAKLQGAKFTHYTSCSSPVWRTGARLLIAGHRL